MAAAFVGCSGSKNNDSGIATPEYIPVGTNAELSGDIASYVTNTGDGSVLAIRQINAADDGLGKQLKPIEKDCQARRMRR